MPSGPNSVPADRCETVVLKATTAAYFRAGYNTTFPKLTQNILLCSPSRGAVEPPKASVGLDECPSGTQGTEELLASPQQMEVTATS